MHMRIVWGKFSPASGTVSSSVDKPQWPSAERYPDCGRNGLSATRTTATPAIRSRSGTPRGDAEFLGQSATQANHIRSELFFVNQFTITNCDVRVELTGT